MPDKYEEKKRGVTPRFSPEFASLPEIPCGICGKNGFRNPYNIKIR